MNDNLDMYENQELNYLESLASDDGIEIYIINTRKLDENNKPYVSQKMFCAGKEITLEKYNHIKEHFEHFCPHAKIRCYLIVID